MKSPFFVVYSLHCEQTGANMESRIEESVVEAKPAYPALRKSKQTGMVVLFTSWGCGAVVMEEKTVVQLVPKFD